MNHSDTSPNLKFYLKTLSKGNISEIAGIAATFINSPELLLEHYPEEKSEALGHLDFAIGEFRDMKMQPSLERALKHKEILGA